MKNPIIFGFSSSVEPTGVIGARELVIYSNNFFHALNENSTPKRIGSWDAPE